MLTKVSDTQVTYTHRHKRVGINLHSLHMYYTCPLHKDGTCNWYIHWRQQDNANCT